MMHNDFCINEIDSELSIFHRIKNMVADKYNIVNNADIL